MKKILKAILCISLLFSTTKIFAQNTDSCFNHYWFLQLNGGIAHTIGESSFGKLISPSLSINAGYRFTPVLSLRFGLEGWQGKGADALHNAIYRYNYIQGNLDVQADLSCIFSNYRKERTFSPYVYLGVGINGAFDNEEAVQSLAPGAYVWDNNLVSPAGRFGIGTEVRLTDVVGINIEAGANILNDKFNSKKGSAVDWQLTAKAGLTFKIGAGKAKGQKVADSECEQPQQAYSEVQPETVPIMTEANEEKPEESVPVSPVVVFKEITENVYFQIGKYNIGESEIIKINGLVELLEDNPDVTIKVTGYADSSTGSSKRNMFLSKKRAESVVEILKNRGISESRIVLEYKGDTFQPYDTPEANRVAICIVY